MFRRRMIRARAIRRGARRLSRAAIIAMVRAARGISLAEIASRANISEGKAKKLMEDLVSEKIIKKEERNGKMVYVA